MVKVVTVASEVDTDDCWIWAGATNNKGYGMIWNTPRHSSAHRIMYETAKGPIPEGLHIDHLCCEPLCVNPIHLEAVTAAENMQRKRMFTKRNHCVRGHELTKENCYYMLKNPRNGRIGRQCMTCKRAKMRVRQAKWRRGDTT